MPIIIEVSTNATASVADLAKLKAAITDAITATNKQTEATKTQGDAAEKAGRQGSSSKQQEKRDTDSLAAAFKGAQGAFSGFIGQLQREADMLQSIHGPMAETQNDLKALDALYRRGALSITEYTSKSAALQKQLDSQTRTAHGLPGAPASSGGGMGDGLTSAIQGVGSAAGPGGEILGAITTGAMVQVGAIVGLAAAVISLHDAYAEFENQAMRIVGVNGDLTGTIQKQLNLAGDLHGSLSTTMALTAKVREGTEDFNLTQQQMMNLTKEVGQAVQLSGHPLEDAAGVMDRLSYAFESGTITGRELKGIMREFPEIGDLLSKSMMKGRKDLVDLANQGRITPQMILNAFEKAGPELDNKFGKRIETYGQQWQHLKDEITVGSQTYGLNDTIGNAKMIGDLSRQPGAAQSAVGFGNKISSALGMGDVLGADTTTEASAANDEYAEKIGRASGAENQFYEQLAKVNQILRDQSGAFKGLTDLVNSHADAVSGAIFKIDAASAKAADDVKQLNLQLAHAYTPQQVQNALDLYGDKHITDMRRSRDAQLDLTKETESYGAVVAEAKGKTNARNDAETSLNDAMKRGKLTWKEYSDALREVDVDFAFQEDLLRRLEQPAKDYGNTIAAMIAGLASKRIDLVQFNEEMAKLHGLTNQRFLDNEQLAKMGAGAYSFGKDLSGKTNRTSGVLSFDTEETANPETVQQLKDMTEAYKNFNHEQTLGAKYVDDQMRHQEEYTAILGDARTAAEKYGQELKILSDPKVLVTDDERAQALQNLKDKYTTIQTPQDAYTKALRKIIEEELLVGGSTTAYANAMRDLRVQFNQGDAMDGFSQGIDNINKSINVSASASKLLSDSFDGVLNGLNELAIKGTTDFHSMTQAIEADLLRLMENQLLRALFGGSLGGDNPAGAAGAIGGLTSWIPGFASGTGPEGITVGGSGPPDSKLMRVSPGEHVTVQTGQQRQRSQQSGTAPGINIINVSNAQEAAHAEMNSRRGESTLINALAKNSRMIGHITRR